MKAQIQQLLEQTVSSLKAAALIPVELEPRIQVDNTKDKAHGDLATNLAMLLAKPAGKNPRELAQLIIDHLPTSTLVAKAEIAGPGFINFFLDSAWLAKQIEAIAASPTAEVKPAVPAQTIVTDYSAPNVAKEMAVHHIRSTVIGDAVTRTLEFLGHNVIRANHIGDWGTQFGMLIAYLEKVQNEQASELELSDLEAFYREAKKHYDEDEVFAERARGYVVKLQGGDEYCRAMWKKLVDITMAQNQLIYDRLNVSLTEKDVMGESLYNPMLRTIVEDLQAQGLAVASEGALVVYLDEIKGKDGEAMAVIIQKRDGGGQGFLRDRHEHSGRIVLAKAVEVIALRMVFIAWKLDQIVCVVDVVRPVPVGRDDGTRAIARAKMIHRLLRHRAEAQRHAGLFCVRLNRVQRGIYVSAADWIN